MNFDIYQEQTAVVTKDGENYLTVKRRQRWKLISEFYKNEELIFKCTRTSLGPVSISIASQNLPDFLTLEKISGKFYLTYLDNELYIDIRYFKKPHFLLYKNGNNVGQADSSKSITIGYSEYKLHTEINEENTNLYFLLLFLVQIVPIR